MNPNRTVPSLETTMTNTTTRTPTPYRIGNTPTTIVRTGPDGQTIVVAVTETLGATQSYGQMCADARSIVKACGAHEQLVAALRDVLKHEEWHAAMADEVTDEARSAIKAAREALAATEAA